MNPIAKDIGYDELSDESVQVQVYDTVTRKTILVVYGKNTDECDQIADKIVTLWNNNL